MDLNSILFSFVFFLLTALVALIILMAFYLYATKSKPDLSFQPSENKFVHFPHNQPPEHHTFPSLLDPPSVSLSVVVPAYNEQDRLATMVEETTEYLENRIKNDSKFSYEVIIVDDGSTDDTSKIALTFTGSLGSHKFRVLTQTCNRGKGGAVRMGVLRSRGREILFADADGASRFADVSKLEKELARIVAKEERMGVVCGSRAHMEQDSIANRSIFRTLLMHCFHFLVWALCVRGVRDTQCGFKLFSRDAARLLFLNLHVHRWAFDVDLLHIAQHFEVPISEVAVNWTEIPGSKLSPILASIQMFKDLVMIRLRYVTGSWQMKALQELKME